MNPEPRPPRFAEWILKRLVPPGVVGESILGDLRESFSEAIQSRGPLGARACYWTDVLRIAIHRPRRTGGVRSKRERGSNGRWLEALTPDVRLALRMLVKSPLLTVVGGLGLAVGIVVSIGFFTFMTFYYSDPPVEDGDRVVSVAYVEGGNSVSTLFDYQHWKDALQSIEDLAAYRIVERDLKGPMIVSGPADVAEMTASAFRVARVPPLLGRPLLDSDEITGAPRVVVIGYREWHQRFGADPAVVGRQLRLDGTLHTVVGVMPEDFRLPVDHGFWIPLVTGTAVAGTAGGVQIRVFGRLASGVEPAAAQAEVAVIGARMIAEYPKVYARLRPVVRPYIRQVLDMLDVPAWQIWLAQIFGGLILIVVGVNVAVLFYARTARRRVEIIVRTALGASRSRIVTQLFLEALALSAVAAALGFLIAQAGFRQLVLVSDFQGLPYWLLGGLPPETVLYTAGLAVVAAVVVGVIPALQATGRHLQSTLREMGGGTGLRIGRTWTALICAQVAIAVWVLPAVVGIAWTYTPPPTAIFPASEILRFRLPTVSLPPGAADSDQPAADAAYGSLQAELLRRVEAIPEVAGVTFASFASGVRIDVEGATFVFKSTPSGSMPVDIKYFSVLGVPLVTGRSFDESDAAEGSTAAIVNRAFVDEYFAGGSAVGRRFREVPVAPADGYVSSERWFIVVGVVENMVRPSEPYVYHPMSLGTKPLGLVARTRGISAASISPRVREVAAEIAPGSAVRPSPMDSRYEADPTELRLVLSMVGLATLSVLLLSAAGISAMMSFAVTQRRREIGIRTALGASRREVLASIFWRSSRQLGIGILIGAAGAVLLDRLTDGDWLYGEVGPLLAFVAAVMLVSGLLATLGPARRALRIEPTEALRED